MVPNYWVIRQEQQEKLLENVSKTVRKLALTPELVALCHRDVADPGPEAKSMFFHRPAKIAAKGP